MGLTGGSNGTLGMASVRLTHHPYQMCPASGPWPSGPWITAWPSIIKLSAGQVFVRKYLGAALPAAPKIARPCWRQA